jgi:hypothetical protein
MGHYRAVCDDEGKAWNLEYCGPHGYCLDGNCQENVCQPGLRYCDKYGQVVSCDNDGTAKNTTKCESGKTCVYGFCVAKKCHDGDVICNLDGRLVCANGLWTTQQCPAGQVCDEKAKECMKKVCEPFQAVCFHGKSAVCNHTGSGFTLKACGSNEECKDGFCQPKLCAPTQDKDAAQAQDTFDATEPDTAQPDLTSDITQDAGTTGPNRAVINGTPAEFVVKHSCAYSPAQQQLRCVFRAPKVFKDEIPHQDEVQILLTGIQENQTGQFTCEGQGPVRVNVYYKWGKYPSDGQCADYDYTAVKCFVNITEFGMSQGMVRGTFEAPVMEDCTQDNTKAVITHGVFNAQRMF